jgi:uncharacterized membrane protein
MLELFEVIKIVFGSIFVLFLPGLSLSFALFPKKDEIDLVERVALSFGLSIASLPLLIFYLNFLFGLKINLLNVTIVNLLIIALGFAIYYAQTSSKMPKFPSFAFNKRQKHQK